MSGKVALKMAREIFRVINVLEDPQSANVKIMSILLTQLCEKIVQSQFVSYLKTYKVVLKIAVKIFRVLNVLEDSQSTNLNENVNLVGKTV